MLLVCALFKAGRERGHAPSRKRHRGKWTSPNLPCPAGYASRIIVIDRGDVVARCILLLSADACAMQLCEQGLVQWPEAIVG